MRPGLPKGLKLALTGSALSIAIALGHYFEGFSLKAYRDTGGLYTICEGHTGGVTAGQVATPAECERYQVEDHQAALKAVHHLVTVPLPVTREAALIDFTYNLGSGVLARSSVLRNLNAGQAAAGCASISAYHYVGNKDCLLASSNCAGIVIRRAAERWLCEYSQ